jgi:hypothetical protein
MTSRKDLVKHLRATFGSPDAVFPSLMPPEEVLGLVEEFIGRQELQKDDDAKLMAALSDLTASIGSCLSQGQDHGKCSAWLVVLAPLCTSNSKGPSWDFAKLLWDQLLRLAFLPSTGPHVLFSRKAHSAAKDLAIWSFASDSTSDDGESSSPIIENEQMLLSEYFQAVSNGCEVDRMEDLLVNLAKHSPKVSFAGLSKLRY